MMQLSTSAREKLKRLEGFRGKAYIPVPGDVPTIGYGFTNDVKMGDTMTREQADARLIEELRPYERAVSTACANAPNQNEFDALVLLAFNIGIAGFQRSTVLKAHNRGDHQAAARAFALWNKSGGQVYPGLTRRRAEESALYLTPVPDDVSDPEEGATLDMPQTVDAERPMTASTINRASVVAGSTATVATVAETARAVADIHDSATDLGAWLVPALLACIVLLCGYVVWERFNQRKQGVA